MGAIVGAVTGTWDPNIVDGGPGTVLREANNNDQEALDKLGDEPTFQCRAFTDSAETVDVLNLNNLGVTWPVNSVRNVRCKVWARNKAGTKAAYSESLTVIIGNGATAAALSVATAGVGLTDTRFVARVPLVGSASATVQTAAAALKFISAVPVITGSKVVVRLSGGLTAVDLNWVVEVQVGRFRVLTTPIATAGS
jgi:hypothetical protein